jgi:uncharacterized protein YndB with AHSA1/START domain
MSAVLADDELLITHTFDAPAELVFSLWAKAEHMRRWMGPDGFDCPHAEIDFRVGGAYRGMIKSAEHGENWFGGVYREIVPHRRLVFTFAWDAGPSSRVETLVTLTFTERDGKTVQMFHQTPFTSVDARDRHVGGWTSSFDKLVAYAEKIAKEKST